MKERDGLVQLSCIGYDVLGVVAEHSLLDHWWGGLIFALHGQLSDTFLQLQVAGWNGLFQQFSL